MPGDTCQHEHVAMVATQAQVVTVGALIVGNVEWCVDCGAIRASTSEDSATRWLTPGGHNSALAYADIQRRAARAKLESIVADALKDSSDAN